MSLPNDWNDRRLQPSTRAVGILCSKEAGNGGFVEVGGTIGIEVQDKRPTGSRVERIDSSITGSDDGEIAVLYHPRASAFVSLRCSVSFCRDDSLRSNFRRGEMDYEMGVLGPPAARPPAPRPTACHPDPTPPPPSLISLPPPVLVGPPSLARSLPPSLARAPARPPARCPSHTGRVIGFFDVQPWKVRIILEESDHSTFNVWQKRQKRTYGSTGQALVCWYNLFYSF